MKKTITLFGPPGVGKSIIVKITQEKGLNAFDMENLGENYLQKLKALKKIFKKHLKDITIFGVADLQRSDFPEETEKILLLPSKRQYILRARKRN